jgi:hypothetical protein
MRLFVFLTICLFAFFADAYVVPTYRDLKPATQVMIEHQDFGTPIGASTGYYKAAGTAGPGNSSALVITSFLNSAAADVPRNITMTPSGSLGGGGGCTVAIVGTNFLGKAATENLVFANGQTTVATGNNAFKTVSSVTFPALCEGTGNYGTTVAIGVGTKLGLKNCMNNAGDWAWGKASGVYSATRATISVGSSTAVEQNTATFNESLTGSADMTGYFVQNFLCLP